MSPGETDGSEPVRTGSCLCGSIRYETHGEPGLVENCHCTDCQRQAGAAYVTFVDFERDAVDFHRGEVRWFRTSTQGRRGICARCGTFLIWEAPDSEHMSVTLVSLDDHSGLVPKQEIWTRSRLPWVKKIVGAKQYETVPDAGEK